MKKRIETALRDLYSAPVERPDPASIERTISKARKSLAFSAAARQRPFRPVGFLEILAGQVRFIARSVWLLQGVFLAVTCLIIKLAAGQRLTSVLYMSAIFTAMTALPFYGRAQRYKVLETEAVTRISLARTLLAKLCIIGIGDALCLSLIILFWAGSADSSIETAFIYVIIPYLLAGTGSLFILNHCHRQQGIEIVCGYCLGLGVLFKIISDKIQFSRAELSLTLAVAVCAVLSILLLFECRSMLCKVRVNDMVPLMGD